MTAIEQSVVGRPALSRGMKLLYGAGAGATGAYEQVFGLLLLFYNQVVGVPAGLVASAIGASVMIDALWDPVIGQVSDRLRTRWGRRHPLMYAAILPAAASFILLLHPPAGWSDQALAAYLLVMVLIVRFSTSLFEVPNIALAPELAPAYHDRTVILGYRWIFRTLGSAAAAVLAYGIFLRATPEYPKGQLNPDGYGPLAITTAVLMIAAMLASCLGTHRGIARLHKPAEPTPGLAAMIREVAATVRNWNFGVMVAAGLVGGVAAGLMGGFSIYLNTYFWELPSISILMIVLVSLVSTPLAGVIARVCSGRWGKRNACVGLFAIAVLSNGAPILLRLLELFPENGSAALVPLLMFQQVVTGSLGIAGWILTASMTSDIVEEAQLRTGVRSEGLLLSAESTLLKLVTGVGVALPGVMLALVDFPEHATPGQVDPAILERLGWIYLPVVTILAFVSTFVRALYRIDKVAHERNLASIRQGVAAGRTNPAGEPDSASPQGATAEAKLKAAARAAGGNYG